MIIRTRSDNVFACIFSITFARVAITTAMYAGLFQNPGIEAMFDRAAQQSADQPRRLAGAILADARNIDKLQTSSRRWSGWSRGMFRPG